jgi:DNA-binding SARP family transcriptional activator
MGAAMNIDERLEALVQTVERLASLHKENEQRLAAVMDTMSRMGRILEMHEANLDDHEDRLDDLEHPGQ